MKFRDLDKFDSILDEHFSNDRAVKIGAANTGRRLSEASVTKIAESNRKHKEENPLTAKQKKQIGDAMRGKTLEELVGEEAAERGRKKRSEASKGKKRPAEVGEKIAATRRARGSYDGRCMRGKEHKDSTREMMAVKAQIRQDLRRSLNLGKAGKLPRELLEAEYKRAGL
jgi:hypothetical protein